MLISKYECSICRTKDNDRKLFTGFKKSTKYEDVKRWTSKKFPRVVYNKSAINTDIYFCNRCIGTYNRQNN